VRISVTRKQHDHKFKRQIVDTSITLDAPGGRKDKMNQFSVALKSLMANCILVDDKFQIDPREPESDKEPLYHQDQIGNNHAVMSFHIRTSGGSESFDIQKPRRDDKKEGGRRRNQNYNDSDEEEPDMVNPQVYLNFACSLDMDPHELFECVGVEWGRVGGQKVYLKAFSSLNTDTTVMCLQSWNRISPETFLDEFTMMFKETKELINDQMDLECRVYEDYPRPIPVFNVRLMNPKLKGEDTMQYHGWPTAKAFKRKAIHIESEMKEADYIHTVVDAMKNSGIVRKDWGKNLHLSNILCDKRGQVALLPGELHKLYGMA
jgi:hypothetical protein